MATAGECGRFTRKIYTIKCHSFMLNQDAEPTKVKELTRAEIPSGLFACTKEGGHTLWKAVHGRTEVQALEELSQVPLVFLQALARGLDDASSITLQSGLEAVPIARERDVYEDAELTTWKTHQLESWHPKFHALRNLETMTASSFLIVNILEISSHHQVQTLST